MGQQLTAFPEVKEAYLEEKEVTLFPEKRFCVLGIVRKQSFIYTEAAFQKLTQLLSDKLESPVRN